MAGEVRCASPYPWGDGEGEVSHPASIKLLREQRYVGSGFQALQHQLRPDSEMDENAKLILNNLLAEHNVNLGKNNQDDDAGSRKQSVEDIYGGKARPLKRSKLSAEISEQDNILELAQDGKLSVFSSILDTVESSSQPVPTKTVIRKCCLQIKPSDLPGTIDAKEYILGALHFLSTQFESNAEERYPSLPLIYPIQLTGDLEKRNYEKFGEWKLDEIQEKVLQLEHLFITSPHNWKWLRRETFSPRLSQDEETNFFLKGVIPARATAKKPKGEPGRKRKTTATAASSATSASAPEPVESTTSTHNSSAAEGE